MGINRKGKKMMKWFSIIMFSISLVCLVFILSCSKSDPMNMPIKASTLKEYEDSIVRISKAIDDPKDRKNFLEALEIVAIGPQGLIERNLPDKGGGYEYERQIEGLVKRFNGKTPREIIMFAENGRRTRPGM